MKKTVLAVVVSAAAPLLAAEPIGFVVWSGSELKDYGQKLAPKMNDLVMIAHRQADGEAELHETQADFFVVQGGAATLVVGGEVVDGKTTAPGEVRGPSIKGGQSRPLAAGDIVHIPAKVPHPLLVPAGKEFTYFIIKVDTP